MNADTASTLSPTTISRPPPPPSPPYTRRHMSQRQHQRDVRRTPHRVRAPTMPVPVPAPGAQRQRRHAPDRPCCTSWRPRSFVARRDAAWRGAALDSPRLTHPRDAGSAQSPGHPKAPPPAEHPASPPALTSAAACANPPRLARLLHPRPSSSTPVAHQPPRGAGGASELGCRPNRCAACVFRTSERVKQVGGTHSGAACTERECGVRWWWWGEGMAGTRGRHHAPATTPTAAGP